MTAIILGLVAAICWGLHDITIRYLSRSIPLLSALAVVLCAGLGFQSVVIFANGGTSLFSTQALPISIGAGFAFLMASLGLYYAFERGPVRLVSPIIGSYPIATLGLAAFNGTPISGAQIAAVGILVFGVGLVAVLSDTTTDKTPPKLPTIVLSILSALGFALTFEMGQAASRIDGDLTSTFWLRLTTLIALGIIIIVVRPSLKLPRNAVLQLILMGILDGVAVMAIMAASETNHPHLAAIAGSIFGLITIILAWVFLREKMNAAQWIGCLLAFGAIGYLAT